MAIHAAGLGGASKHSGGVDAELFASVDVGAGADRAGVLSAGDRGWVFALPNGSEMGASVAKCVRSGIRVAVASTGMDVGVGASDPPHQTNTRIARVSRKSETMGRKTRCPPGSSLLFISIPPKIFPDESALMETARIVFSSHEATILPVLRLLSVNSRQSLDFPGNIGALTISMLG